VTAYPWQKMAVGGYFRRRSHTPFRVSLLPHLAASPSIVESPHQFYKQHLTPHFVQ
jgi:hypothetical protein